MTSGFSALWALGFFVLSPPAWAQTDAGGTAPALSNAHYGLLRVRDLSPFGFLRLDMRPSHAVLAPPGNWAVEAELGYQNTWALSTNVEDYLNSLPGRRRLGPAEIQAIRDLPGDAYLVDLELALLDVTLHYKFTERWGVYAVLSGVRYSGGFIDGAIENFHDAFNFEDVGRPAVNRNDINIIFDTKTTQLVKQQAPTRGSLLDPTFGVRYSPGTTPWNLVLEAAVKIPIRSARDFVSTGRFDIGVQGTVQRFSGRHAGYASLAAVYVDGGGTLPSYSSQLLPTAVLGYEYTLTQRTNLVAQVYASPSVFKGADTDSDQLTKNKYQISLGARYRTGAAVWSFAVTENVASANGTPDIGFQIGWAYSPAIADRR